MIDTHKEKMDVKPWARNVPSFMVLYSLLAAIAGILLSIVLLDNDHYREIWWLPVISLALSLVLFIYSAEKIMDALDEDDAEKYISLFIPYNFAVFLLIFGLITVIYFRYKIEILNLIAIFTGYKLPSTSFSNVIYILSLSIISGYKWLRDIFLLLTMSEKEYQKYIEELEGKRKPAPDRRIGYTFFKIIRRFRESFRKRIAKETQPDFKEVRLELRCSKIDGVGVFATRHIKKGEFIAEGIHEDDYTDIVSWQDFDNISPIIQKKIIDFCIGTPEGFIPPEDFDFNKLSIEWHINHSCDGNIGFNGDGDFVTLKQITTGEELAYDYGLAESNPKFSMKCKCGSNNCRHLITGNDWKDPEFRKKNLNDMLPKLRIEQKQSLN